MKSRVQRNTENIKSQFGESLLNEIFHLLAKGEKITIKFDFSARELAVNTYKEKRVKTH